MSKNQTSFNVFKGREIVFERLNIDGSPLVSPTANDKLLINYTQQVRFARVYEEAATHKNEGPTGTICEVNKNRKLIGATAGLQIAKIVPWLAWLFEGGTFDELTGKHTPPFYDDAAPPPFRATIYMAKYKDGKHDIADVDGFLKLTLPKCTGAYQEWTADNANFANPNVTIDSKEYVDEVTPENSVSCYDFDVATLLPSQDDYAVPFLVKDGEAGVEGAEVSVIVAGVPVSAQTDTEGVAELALPIGVHSYTVKKAAFADKTGTVTVGLINDVVDVTITAG